MEVIELDNIVLDTFYCTWRLCDSTLFHVCLFVGTLSNSCVVQSLGRIHIVGEGKRHYRSGTFLLVVFVVNLRWV